MEFFKRRTERDKWDTYGSDLIPMWAWIAAAAAFAFAASLLFMMR